ncbi:MAG TPA: hypothetical protein VF602_06850 [Pedobacter sp.]|jgi:hypothetical protein
MTEQAEKQQLISFLVPYYPIDPDRAPTGHQKYAFIGLFWIGLQTKNALNNAFKAFLVFFKI